MKYYGTKISDNIAETPEGYLLCLGVSIGRTGEMEYAKDETPLEVGPNGIVLVSRDEEEVFRAQTVASFEGKPFTIQHPEEFVAPENWKDLAKGIMQNVKRGSGDQKDDLVCDLLITDQEAISLVRNGMRGLSCGYEADYIQTGEGKGKQVNIVGNHLALVEEGRAGAGYEIKDHKIGVRWMSKSLAEKIKALVSKTVDQAVKDEEKPKEEAKDEPAAMKDAYDELVKVCNAMKDALEGAKPKDEEKPKEEGKDADLEGRLAKLEAAVAKLLETESTEAAGDKEKEEEPAKDDEGDLIEDEEKEKAADADPEMVGDTASRAEILAPGIKMTKDIKVKALRAAFGTKDGKKVIELLTGGKPPSYDNKDQVELLFNAASEMLKSERGEELSNSKRAKVGDFQSAIFDSSAMTPEKMNEINAKKYKIQ